MFIGSLAALTETGNSHREGAAGAPHAGIEAQGVQDSAILVDLEYLDRPKDRRSTTEQLGVGQRDRPDIRTPGGAQRSR